MTDFTPLERLAATIASRRGGDPAQSYVARMHARGRGKMAQKLGEEATELVIAALTEADECVVGEAADLLFHLLLLLDDRGIALGAVMAEIARREGLSGLAEKAARVEGSPPKRDTP